MNNLILPLLIVATTAHADPATDAKAVAYAHCTAFVLAATLVVDEPQSSVLQVLGDEFYAKGRELNADLFDKIYNEWAEALIGDKYTLGQIRDGAMFCVENLT